MEEAIVGDFALIKAWKADKLGNLIFRQAIDDSLSYAFHTYSPTSHQTPSYPPITAKRRQSPSNAAKHHQMPPITVKRRQSPSNDVNHHQTPPITVKRRQSPSNAAKHCKTQPNNVKQHQTVFL